MMVALVVACISDAVLKAAIALPQGTYSFFAASSSPRPRAFCLGLTSMFAPRICSKWKLWLWWFLWYACFKFIAYLLSH